MQDLSPPPEDQHVIERKHMSTMTSSDDYDSMVDTTDIAAINFNVENDMFSSQISTESDFQTSNDVTDRKSYQYSRFS